MKNLITIILCCISIYAGQGFFAKENWKQREFPQFLNSVEGSLYTRDTMDILIEVDKSDTVAKILSSHFGNNTNPWTGHLYKDSTALQHMGNLDISYMRLPGGNWSNLWLWDHEVPQNLVDGYDTLLKCYPAKNWPLKTDELLQLVDTAATAVQPCVNYALSRYLDSDNRVQEAASYAADWVRDLKARSIPAPYWEVGNENFGPWTVGFTVTGLDTIRGSEYGKDFCIFADSMKAADQTIKVGAGALSDDNGEPWTGYWWWMRDMLPELIHSVDFFSVHDYFTWDSIPDNISVESILASIDKIGEIRSNIDAMIEKYTDSSAGSVPLAFTEFNFRGGKKELTLLAPLFHTMAVAEMIKEQYGLINVWDICNNYAETTDHGLLTRRHPERPDYTPNPSFFAYYFMSGFWGDVLLNVSQWKSNHGVRVYTSAFSDKGYGFIAVNPTEDTLSISLDFKEQKSALCYWYELSADSLLAPSIKINNIESKLYKSGGPEEYWLIPPRRSDVTLNSVKVTLQPWSVIYAALEKEVSVAKKAEENRRIHVEYAKNRLRIEGFQGKGVVSLYTMNGKELWSSSVSGGSLSLRNVAKRVASGLYIIKITESVTDRVVARLPIRL